MSSLWNRGKGQYSITFAVDTGGVKRRITVPTGCSDGRAAAEVQRRVDRLVDLKASGLPLDGELLRWLERLPARVRERLIGLGLAGTQAPNLRPIEDHLNDYFAWCEHQGHDATHLNNKRTELGDLIAWTGARRLSDLNRDNINRFLQNIKKRPAGNSNRTVNRHLSTANAFLNWGVREGQRLPVNPAAGIPRLDESKDQRHPRRAATDAELASLLDVAPVERRVVYLVAVQTGLRRGELKKLLWRDFDLDAATLHVRGEIAKNGKPTLLPLHEQVVAALQKHRKRRATSGAGDAVFPTVPHRKTLRRDLVRAGIEPIDTQGHHLDLHALRTTFTTRLLRLATPSIVKKLTRHSSTRVLEKYYDKLVDADAAEAMASVAPIGPTPCVTTTCPEPPPPSPVAGAPRLRLVGGRAAQRAARDVPRPASNHPEGLRLADQGGIGGGPETMLAAPAQPRYPSVTCGDPLPDAASRVEDRHNFSDHHDLRAVGAVG